MIEKEFISDLTIYTKADYAKFIDKYKDKANSVIASLLENDSISYVSNITSEIIAIGLEDSVWPVSINKKEYDNAIICSPYATYTKYPLDKMDSLDSFWMKGLFLVNSLVMGLFCKATKINQIVQVNNNLNSLLKHPKQFNQILPQLTALLIEKYPSHAVTFFRVNDTINKNLLHNLKKNGYIVFPDRMAHIYFPDTRYMKRSHTKRDMSLLRNTNYQIVQHNDLSDTDAERICELYRKLFVNKHSKFNADYTKEYFSQAIKKHWHHYTALRSPNGRVDAFISWFYRENVMICGPLGYDTGVDRKVGLYRKLIALCLKHAHENQFIFNMGGGSDKFKNNRGSTKTLEYTAVYCKHLPLYRHIPWRLLSWICNKLLKEFLRSSRL